LGRLSLRARLLLGLIAVAAVGLVGADVATYTALKSFLYDRVDSTLNSVHPGVENSPLFGQPRQGRTGPPEDFQQLFRSIPDYCIEVRLVATGQVLAQTCIPSFNGSVAPAPRYPTAVRIPAASNSADGDRVTFLTVPAVSGGGSYRIRASIEPVATNRILLLAAPLNDVKSTLHRLFLIELGVSVAVLASMIGLALWTVRLGLRPLDSMAKTADAIAAGDLTRRVERAEPRTEVGRLGLALNSMLSNIETAVTDRDSSLRALEASERKLRRFVADASHELRTPLAAVRAYAELFTRGAADRPADLERSMKGISRESERMSVLVEDLLLLAHLDEGRPLELEPVALNEVVGEALETAHTLEPARPVEAALAPVTVAGDRDRLRQVIDNLLSNVRSHTPADSALAVRLARDNGWAVLSVEDSGPGMDDEQLSHIFERFYRADPSRARASGGAGLGLAIVAAVVKAHGGEVAAASEPGRGTTFEVRLPTPDATAIS